MSLLLSKHEGLVRAGLVAHYDFSKRNLLAESEAFDQTAWSPSNASVTADVTTAPDGESTADLLVPTSTNAFIRQFVTTQQNQDYTFSVYLKSAGADLDMLIGIFDGSLGLIDSVTITVTGTWQRFEVSANVGANTALQVLLGGGSTWSTGEDIHAWGAQVNEGITVLAYERTTDNQVLADISGRGNDLTLGGSALSEADDPVWANDRLIFDGGDLAQRSVTDQLPSGNSDLTMVVAAKLTALAADSVLLSYGSGTDGATPNLMVDSLDHLTAGFQGSGWTVDVGGVIASQSGFFLGTMRYRAQGRDLDVILNDFSQSATVSLAADAAATNQQIGLGAAFAGINSSSGEVVHGLIYNRRLCDGEIRQVYRAVRRLLLSRGFPLP